MRQDMAGMLRYKNGYRGSKNGDRGRGSTTWPAGCGTKTVNAAENSMTHDMARMLRNKNGDRGGKFHAARLGRHAAVQKCACGWKNGERD